MNERNQNEAGGFMPMRRAVMAEIALAVGGLTAGAECIGQMPGQYGQEESTGTEGLLMNLHRRTCFSATLN